jgi:formylglycine-generating enzyme required for sulfatase activity
VETTRIEAQASYNLGNDRQVIFLLHGDQKSRPPETAQSARTGTGSPANPAPSTTRPAPGVPAGFVQIPGGTFTMGSPPSEPGHQSNEVQHNVTVSSFYMSRYEVTVGDFRRFVNTTGHRTTAEIYGGGYVWSGSTWEIKSGISWRNPHFTQGDNHPVVLVSWYDTVEYCNWLSRQEGLTPAYTISGPNVIWNRNANGYRLPTEAEWEYACRAGTSTPFHTGNNITTSQANYNRGQTWAVGSGALNAWGLYDIHGNANEWCWDWYGDYSSSSQTDPVGPSSGVYRIDRGGTWLHGTSIGLRSSIRYSAYPLDRFYDLGFRLARSAN